MRGVALPPADASWDWPVAPLGENGDDLATLYRVCAWPDFHASLAK